MDRNMKPLKTFSEYLKEGTAKKQSPDKLRARSLIAESEDSYKILLSFIEKMGLDDNNANHVIKNAYDIIMELVRAKMLLGGSTQRVKARTRQRYPTWPKQVSATKM